MGLLDPPGFRRNRHGQVWLHLGDADRGLMGDLLDADGRPCSPSPRPTSPSTRWPSWSGSTRRRQRPEDPALARLFPDAYEDPDDADEFRRFTQRDLRTTQAGEPHHRERDPGPAQPDAAVRGGVPGVARRPQRPAPDPRDPAGGHRGRPGGVPRPARGRPPAGDVPRLRLADLPPGPPGPGPPEGRARMIQIPPSHRPGCPEPALLGTHPVRGHRRRPGDGRPVRPSAGHLRRLHGQRPRPGLHRGLHPRRGAARATPTRTPSPAAPGCRPHGCARTPGGSSASASTATPPPR